MVDKSFRYNDTTVYSTALRKAWNECQNCNIYRMTPEFDKLILDELGEFGEFESTGKIGDVESESDYSPYCELCGSCGEDGCCSHLSCFRTLIQNPKCDYGKTYLADAMFAEKLYKLGFNIIEKLKKHEITSDEAVIEYKKEYDVIWDEIYKDKYGKNTN